MKEADKELLKQKVLDFVKAQNGYDPAKPEKLDAFDEVDDLAVVYGEDIAVGIAGIGPTVDEAYQAFVRSWNDLNGFEWMEKGRKILGH